MPKLIVWGASGHARVVADIIRVADAYEIAGFLDDQHPETAGHPFEGSTILGGRECLAAQRERGVRHLIVAFGHCARRLEAARFAVDLGFTLATAIHAVNALPPNQREVITLRDIEGWSASEVCDALAISEANQRVLLHRARSSVRRALEQYVNETVTGHYA